jgi:hypothetical protein
MEKINEKNKKLEELEEIQESITREELRKIIEERNYDEIFCSTNQENWSMIYDDAGIVKSRFIAELYSEWNTYWDKKNEQKKSKQIIEKLKQDSWRELCLLTMCYDDVNPIDFAYEISDLILYPICVITMLKIFDFDCCIEEYFEYENY